ncbi:MAG: EAL domain-containing protein [Paraglaciecola sp.]|uniref:putative bifunctional diguanylate cyclase/phosphodiesterase n=1 Tax=Paraglaciecola sp. TaxID=1920173 RepID=UPI003298AFB5
MEANIKLLQRMTEWAGFGAKTEQLIFAQFNELLTKVPLLYFVLLVSSLALTYTYYGVAPDYLTVHVAAFLSVACVLRAFKWYRFRFQNFTQLQALHQIRMTVLFSIIMGFGFSIWGFALYGYGDISLRVHVAYYMSVTVIGIIVCLLHLPAAVWSTTLTVGAPFVVFFVNTGELIFVAIAVNFLLVAAVLVLITLSYYRAFSNVIAAKEELQTQHQHTQQLNIQNELLANLDGLTELANRRSFSKHLSQKLRENIDKQCFVVALIDLDGFKPVNDIHGHAAGDRVLKEVSQRLIKVLKGKGFLARIGGDEFALVIDHDNCHEAIQSLGNNITKEIQKPFEMRTGLVQISGSCGFAIYPEGGESVDELMDSADFALYEAKTASRGSSIIFSGEHKRLIKQKSKLELALNQSIKNSELSLNYQPIVDGKTGEIIALEALARWNNPELGMVPPDEFIMIAEKSGMVTEITLCLFEKAVRDLKNWPEHLFLSFNLSVHDVMNQHTLQRLSEILQEHCVSEQRVQLEITETIMMSDLEHCSNTTKMLQQKGFMIALDDFGSGYSSLSYLHKLAFDNLKIDRGFVKNLLEDPRSQGVVKTIVELCSSFNVSCTVEGVETAKQRDLLLTLGCQQMQGYYFYRPAKIEDLKL